MSVFHESKLAHSLLDSLGGTGIEIGPAAHNPFGIRGTLYVGLDEPFYRESQMSMCGQWTRLNVQAYGDLLPFADESLSFVLTSHVLEHFADPIRALRDWWRVIRPGGVIYAIVPHKARTFDRDRTRTPLTELIRRYESGLYPIPEGHFSVWVTEDVVDLMAYLKYPVIAVQDVDDKVGNGFAIAVRKPELNAALVDSDRVV